MRVVAVAVDDSRVVERVHRKAMVE